MIVVASRRIAAREEVVCLWLERTSPNRLERRVQTIDASELVRLENDDPFDLLLPILPMPRTERRRSDHDGPAV